jgi:hypothetical protein
MSVRQTCCRHCGQDIEGLFPYRRGEWRDRGNNPTCPHPLQGFPGGPEGTLHAPVIEGRPIAPPCVIPTRVLFRRWPAVKKGQYAIDGTIIALFPDIPGSGVYDCMSYEQVGQHGACDPAIIASTHPVDMRSDDVWDLVQERQGRGYVLKIVKRIPASAQRLREQAHSKMMNAAMAVQP